MTIDWPVWGTCIGKWVPKLLFYLGKLFVDTPIFFFQYGSRPFAKPLFCVPREDLHINPHTG